MKPSCWLAIGAVCLFSSTLLRAQTSAESVAEICKDSRPDCPQAVTFFSNFQEGIRHADRAAVSAMIGYPLRVRLDGKTALIRNKRQLLQNYDRVFDAAVRCAILAARTSDVWGNWRGFTVSRGAVWWERSAVPDSPFKLITVNNEAYYEGCSDNSEKSPKHD